MPFSGAQQLSPSITQQPSWNKTTRNVLTTNVVAQAFTGVSSVLPKPENIVLLNSDAQEFVKRETSVASALDSATQQSHSTVSPEEVRDRFPDSFLPGSELWEFVHPFTWLG